MFVSINNTLKVRVGNHEEKKNGIKFLTDRESKNKMRDPVGDDVLLAYLTLLA